MAKGILVDTWIYNYQGILCPQVGDGEFAAEPLVGDLKVEVKVRIVKEVTETEKAPHAMRSVSFEATCDKPRLIIIGTDIEAIRTAVWAEMDRSYKIHWSPYFLVTVEKLLTYEGVGNGVHVYWDRVWMGIAHDRTEMLRQMNHCHDNRAGIYKISPGPGVFREKNGRVIACIEATDRNRAALEEFGNRLDHLRKLLADFLSREKIYETLANLARSMPFLPSPDARQG